jgi:hypothetical protein
MQSAGCATLTVRQIEGRKCDRFFFVDDLRSLACANIVVATGQTDGKKEQMKTTMTTA